MSIRQFRLDSRLRVAWFSGPSPAEGAAAFEARGFWSGSDRVVDSTAWTCRASDLLDGTLLAQLSTVIFTQDAEKPTIIADQLTQYAERLLDYDCNVIVIIQPQFVKFLLNTIKRLKLPVKELSRLDSSSGSPSGPVIIPPSPFLSLYTAPPKWDDVANEVASLRPGNAPNHDLKISGTPAASLGLTDKLLIQRAFWDCSEVDLRSLEDGNSPATVFCAHATLRNGLVGSSSTAWPLPYLIKIDRRAQIFKEYENYKSLVEPYVPFHLGPDLVEDRCGLGGTRGILVGNFIEESESLQQCAANGRSLSPIACLFNRSLRGWYRGAVKTDQPPFLREEFFPRVSASKFGERFQAAQRFGATRTFDELITGVKAANVKQKVLIGPSHGDLHARNIRVRATDAILIDFLRGDLGPLLWDIGCLEASLLVEGFGEDDREGQEWLNSIAPLYSKLPLQELSECCSPRDKSAWFYECIWKLRLYARELEQQPGQYALFLAVALLSKASKDCGIVKELEENHRAGAYVFAERLLAAAGLLTPAVAAVAGP